MSDLDSTVPKVPPSQKAREPNAGAAGAGAPGDDAKPKSEIQDKLKDANATPCAEFTSTGKCQFGVTCRFLHAQKPRVKRPKEEIPPRYFLVKSENQENVETSVMKRIWSSFGNTKMEIILKSAFKTCESVFLIFVVENEDGFAGYCKMKSEIRDETSQWTTEAGVVETDKLFDVEWVNEHGVPFSKCVHLKNPLDGQRPLNAFKEDGQEVPKRVSAKLFELFTAEKESFDEQRRSSAHRSSPNSTDDRARQDSPQPKRAEPPATKERCQFFGSKTGCHSGDNCRFFHSVDASQRPARDDDLDADGRRVCFKLRNTGDCKYGIDDGGKCPYSHNFPPYNEQPLEHDRHGSTRPKHHGGDKGGVRSRVGDRGEEVGRRYDDARVDHAHQNVAPRRKDGRDLSTERGSDRGRRDARPPLSRERSEHDVHGRSQKRARISPPTSDRGSGVETLITKTTDAEGRSICFKLRDTGDCKYGISSGKCPYSHNFHQY